MCSVSGVSGMYDSGHVAACDRSISTHVWPHRRRELEVDAEREPGKHAGPRLESSCREQEIIQLAGPPVDRAGVPRSLGAATLVHAALESRRDHRALRDGIEVAGRSRASRQPRGSTARSMPAGPPRSLGSGAITASHTVNGSSVIARPRSATPAPLRRTPATLACSASGDGASAPRPHRTARGARAAPPRQADRRRTGARGSRDEAAVSWRRAADQVAPLYTMPLVSAARDAKRFSGHSRSLSRLHRDG